MLQDEPDMLAELRQAAMTRFGRERAAELDRRLMDIARWLALIGQQPLDLLDEEPDVGR